MSSVPNYFKMTTSPKYNDGSINYANKVVDLFNKKGKSGFQKVNLEGLKKGLDGIDNSVVKMATNLQAGNMSIDDFIKKTINATTTTSKFLTGLKKVGSIAASMGTAFLVMEGISLALKALDDYTHQYTRALENASTAYLPRRY